MNLKQIVRRGVAGGLLMLLITNVFGYETNRFKLIPNGTPVINYDIDKNRIIDFYWWDKDKNKKMESNEILMDLNQDGIPDISYQKLIELYEKYGKSRSYKIEEFLDVRIVRKNDKNKLRVEEGD